MKRRKNTYNRYVLPVLAALVMIFSFWGCSGSFLPENSTAARGMFSASDDTSASSREKPKIEYIVESEDFSADLYQENIPEDGSYTTLKDVASYLIEYETLPDNFITKKEAKKLGWTGGSLEPYAPGKCIGGDYFGNYEGLLPDDEGQTYYECDIDALGENRRGAKRIVYSDDGEIYYTEDHYETFTLLYEEKD